MDIESKIQKIKKFESEIRQKATSNYELGLINGIEYCLSVLEETKLKPTTPKLPDNGDI